MRPATAVAPAAPARMGEPVDPAAMMRYLTELGEWRDQRRRELDELDRSALAAPDAASLTGDVTLSMALWQAVAARHDELVRVFDGGRVGPVELRRLSALVWGRLDAGTGGPASALAVSLPEACRLSDALAGQLRLRLSLDPVGLDLAAHLRSLRAALERVRDLVEAEPEGPAREGATSRLRRLDRRLADVLERAGRGADVGGLVGPLEADAARAERDLIVAGATRRDDERDRERAQVRRDELAVHAAEVARLADECVARVSPAPRLAVPRVEALGPVPEDAAGVDDYLARLDAVSRALRQAQSAYAAPVAELDGLRDLLEVYRAKADGTGRARLPEVAEMYRLARAVVGEVPAELARARAVVAAYGVLLSDVPPTLDSSGRNP
jgi:hypothetical protein